MTGVLTGFVMGVWSIVASGVSAPHHVPVRLVVGLQVAGRPVTDT